MLSTLRLFMIPAFVVCYFKYTVGAKTAIAAGVYVVAWATDALDGYLARRNGWITDIGKFIDPLADKLMQLAAMLCFSSDNPLFYIISVPFFLKEITMLFAALVITRKHKIVVSANWYGKLSTVILFLCAGTRIFVRNNLAVDIAIIVLMLACMIFSFVMYYTKEYKAKYATPKTR